MSNRVRVDCTHCRGAGVLPTKMTLEGGQRVGVVCVACGGKGYRKLNGKLFTGRRALETIDVVVWGSPDFDLAERQGLEPDDISVSYDKFRSNDQLPPEEWRS